MSATIINWRDWQPDAQHITFGKANKNQYGSYNMGMRYNGERLYLRTPKMRCPFGLSEGYEGKGYNVQLCFDKEDADCQEFFKKFEQFDALVRATGVANAFDWKIAKTAGEVLHDAVIDTLFKPCVKWPVFKQGHPQQGQRNTEYPPYLQITILESKPKDGEVYPEGHERAGEKKEPEILTELYDTHQQPLYVDEDSIPNQCHLTGIIYATSAYKSTTGFGVVWKAAQFMVYPRQGLEMGKCHIEPDAFPDEDFNAAPQSFGSGALADGGQNTALEQKTVPQGLSEVTPVATGTATVTAGNLREVPVTTAPATTAAAPAVVNITPRQ